MKIIPLDEIRLERSIRSRRKQPKPILPIPQGLQRIPMSKDPFLPSKLKPVPLLQDLELFLVLSQRIIPTKLQSKTKLKNNPRQQTQVIHPKILSTIPKEPKIQKD
jgi:hypothetical protein